MATGLEQRRLEEQLRRRVRGAIVTDGFAPRAATATEGIDSSPLANLQFRILVRRIRQGW